MRSWPAACEDATAGADADADADADANAGAGAACTCYAMDMAMCEVLPRMSALFGQHVTGMPGSAHTRVATLHQMHRTLLSHCDDDAGCITRAAQSIHCTWL